MGFFSVLSGNSDSELDEVWNGFSAANDLKKIRDKSDELPQLIYKHSHRCGVCVTSKKQIEKAIEQIRDLADFYFVNVVNQRNISDHIAEKLDVRHESPQVIILKDRKVLWHGSHWEIKDQAIIEKLSSDPVSS